MFEYKSSKSTVLWFFFKTADEFLPATEDLRSSSYFFLRDSLLWISSAAFLCASSLAFF
jgi:hypothetical protein